MARLPPPRSPSFQGDRIAELLAYNNRQVELRREAVALLRDVVADCPVYEALRIRIETFISGIHS